MDLSKEQRKKLFDALLSAFPRLHDLEIMLDLELGVRLGNVARQITLPVAILDLIGWAQAQGRVEDLVGGARRANPGNELLKRVAIELGQKTETASSGPASTSPLDDPAATSETPALIVYLMDLSASTSELVGEVTKLDVAQRGLAEALKRMVYNSTRITKDGNVTICPRYRVAIFAYADQVPDVFGGAKTIDRLAIIEPPGFVSGGEGNAALAFSTVERFLRQELPYTAGGPTPLVCHVTDGQPIGEAAFWIAKEVASMSVSSHPILFENIVISDDVLAGPLISSDVELGVASPASLQSTDARRLFEITSIIPPNRREAMLSQGYRLRPGARMFFPSTSQQLVSLAFQLSVAPPGLIDEEING